MGADRDLDILIAERVMGLKLDYEFADELGAPTVPALRDQYDEWGILPHYSTDIADAWMVVERMRQSDLEYAFGLRAAVLNNPPYTASFEYVEGTHGYSAEADTPALVICLAALRTFHIVV